MVKSRAAYHAFLEAEAARCREEANALAPSPVAVAPSGDSIAPGSDAAVADDATRRGADDAVAVPPAVMVAPANGSVAAHAPAAAAAVGGGDGEAGGDRANGGVGDGDELDDDDDDDDAVQGEPADADAVASSDRVRQLKSIIPRHVLRGAAARRLRRRLAAAKRTLKQLLKDIQALEVAEAEVRAAVSLLRTTAPRVGPGGTFANVCLCVLGLFSVPCQTLSLSVCGCRRCGCPRGGSTFSTRGTSHCRTPCWAAPHVCPST